MRTDEIGRCGEVVVMEKMSVFEPIYTYKF